MTEFFACTTPIVTALACILLVLTGAYAIEDRAFSAGHTAMIIGVVGCWVLWQIVAHPLVWEIVGKVVGAVYFVPAAVVVGSVGLCVFVLRMADWMAEQWARDVDYPSRRTVPVTRDPLLELDNREAYWQHIETLQAQIDAMDAPPATQQDKSCKIC